MPRQIGCGQHVTELLQVLAGVLAQDDGLVVQSMRVVSCARILTPRVHGGNFAAIRKLCAVPFCSVNVSKNRQLWSGLLRRL